MKLRYCFLGLAIVSATLVPFNAQAQSKPAECQSFEAVMIRYNDRVSNTTNDPTDPQGIAENLLVDLNLSIEDLESLTFSDLTLRSLHQQSLEYVIAGRDNLATHLSEVKQGQQATTGAAFGELQRLPYQISEVLQQFEQYCGKSANNP